MSVEQIYLKLRIYFSYQNSRFCEEFLTRSRSSLPGGSPWTLPHPACISTHMDETVVVDDATVTVKDKNLKKYSRVRQVWKSPRCRVSRTLFNTVRYVYGHLLNFDRNRVGGGGHILHTMARWTKNKGWLCKMAREGLVYADSRTLQRCSVRRVYSLLREYLARIDTLGSREEALVTLQVHGTLNSVTNSPGRLSVSSDMWAPAQWSRRKVVSAFKSGFELSVSSNCLSRNPLRNLRKYVGRVLKNPEWF